MGGIEHGFGEMLVTGEALGQQKIPVPVQGSFGGGVAMDGEVPPRVTTTTSTINGIIKHLLDGIVGEFGDQESVDDAEGGGGGGGTVLFLGSCLGLEEEGDDAVDGVLVEGGGVEGLVFELVKEEIDGLALRVRESVQEG